MGDPFRKVRPGEPMQIPAKAYNAFVDAARAHQATQNFGGGSLRDQRRFDTVLIKNDTEEAIGRFGILGLDAPIILPETNEREFKQKVAFSGVAPTLADHFGRFAILIEPLAAGAVGRGIVSGVCPVKLKNGAEKGLPFADIDDEETGWLMPSSAGAAQILWFDTETDWAIVRLGPLSTVPIWCELTEDLQYQRLGKAEIQVRNPNWVYEHVPIGERGALPEHAPWLDTNVEILVISFLLKEGERLPSGSRCLAQLSAGGLYEITSSDTCPEDDPDAEDPYVEAP
jgi:hypothetical protein